MGWKDLWYAAMVTLALWGAAQEPPCAAKEALARAQGGWRSSALIQECLSDHLDEISQAFERRAEIRRQMEQAAMAERKQPAVEFREKK